MVSWLKSYSIVLMISLLETRKLTKEENEKRLEQCGKAVLPKVYNGRNTDEHEAPWVVQEHPPGCSATLISPRHVMSATHCVSKENNIEYKNNSIGYKFDREKACKNNKDIVITEVLASKVTVTSMGKQIGRAKYLIWFNYCYIVKKEYYREYPVDFMIIELSEDVEYSPTLQPACVARDISEHAPGTILDFYGFGVDYTKPNERAMRHHKLKVIEKTKDVVERGLDKHVMHVTSLTGKTTGCYGDSGGGAVAKIDGRVTVMGAFMRMETLENEKCSPIVQGRLSIQFHASAGFFAADICKYTGICTPPRSSADGFSMTASLFVCILTMFL